MAGLDDDKDLDDMRATADDLARTFRELKTLSSGFSSALSSGLKAAVVEGKKLDTVMREVAVAISGKLLDQALKPLTATLASGLASGVTGILSPTAGTITPFARGGVVAAPTYFPMGEGGTGLAGEAGAEAILPLARSPDGRLGVRAGSGNGVNVTFNVTTPDVDGFRRSKGQMATMLARAVGRGRRGL
ncbi:phage tail tape measure protein [Rhodobium gokarnense]|uniref:Phage-related minor tail protein n=1 Tax=Rhodobium gokarnense TaxID=364296 RepID=A0ABT3HC12_9HYPH|nr:phage tail tape measure protein [Rhodobium gokarnense]MCW2307889.1 phage-related minor tail protein [Rhodobium gokarnense]